MACSICGRSRLNCWWKQSTYRKHLRAVILTLGIVRKPWHRASDEPFANIDLKLAWKVAKGIHLEG